MYKHNRRHFKDDPNTKHFTSKCRDIKYEFN